MSVCKPALTKVLPTVFLESLNKLVLKNEELPCCCLEFPSLPVFSEFSFVGREKGFKPNLCVLLPAGIWNFEQVRLKRLSSHFVKVLLPFFLARVGINTQEMKVLSLELDVYLQTHSREL